MTVHNHPIRFQNRYTGEQRQISHWDQIPGSSEPIAVFTATEGEERTDRWSKSLLYRHWEQLPCDCPPGSLSIVV